MAVLDWLFAPEPEACPAPIDLPDWYRDLTRDADLLPPIPPPPPGPETPPPTTAALLALAVATAAKITDTLRGDDDCEEGCEKCIPLHAGAGGIPPRMPYADQRTSRVGYEYQHHVVNWFFHDAEARIIMEWQFNGVWFDGLDSTRGTLLAGRGIQRAEYDPVGESRCYLIDTKYGYEVYVRYDAWAEEWVRSLDFFWDPWEVELGRQDDAFRSSYPNVMLLWIFSNQRVRQIADSTLLATLQPRVASVYYSYIAQEDRP